MCVCWFDIIRRCCNYNISRNNDKQIHPVRLVELDVINCFMSHGWVDLQRRWLCVSVGLTLFEDVANIISAEITISRFTKFVQENLMLSTVFCLMGGWIFKGDGDVCLLV
eukprot:Seg2068.1 transcript_id=Seg2068.1/GoldUCD/mRNA.D3Y31 product="hypothetical protein" protein_id=Seg2068.1/GoldUCD/D3Y31